MARNSLVLLLAASLTGSFASSQIWAQGVSGIPSGEPSDTSASQAETLSLSDCIAQALANSHKRKISGFMVEMAQAMHRQVLSGYWPQVKFEAGVQRSDQPVNFLFPAQAVNVPASAIPIPAGTALVSIPANAFGPGFPPATVQLPVSSAAGVVRTPAETFSVASQSLKVLDRNLASGTLQANYLVVDGGLRKGLGEQALANLQAMQAEAHRNELEVEHSVRRMYWAAVLANELLTLGQDVLARMEVTLKLTEHHINDATGKSSKTDYLYNKVIVESVRAAMAELEKNRTLARAALAGDMGLGWNVSVRPVDETLPDPPVSGPIDQLVADTYRFNPDWQKLEAGIRAADATLSSTKSEYFPKLAITGNLHRFWNGGFNGGLATPQNLTGWTVGAGVEVPVFNGMLTHNKAAEAIARIRQLRETQLLLKDGLGLEVKSLLTDIESARKVMQATGDALQSADENRELNMRAYESDMAEPEKVIQAQLIAALVHAQYLKARHDALALSSDLVAVIGHELSAQIDRATPAHAH